jgi:hypothetical protein
MSKAFVNATLAPVIPPATPLSAVIGKEKSVFFIASITSGESQSFRVIVHFTSPHA